MPDTGDQVLAPVAQVALGSAAPPVVPGRAVPIASLILTTVTALVVGFGLYRMLASIKLSFDPFGGIAVWGTVALVGLFLGPFACALGVVAAVRCRRRPIGWVALVAAFILPLTTGTLGLVQGVDKARTNATHTVVQAGDGIACLVGEEGWNGLDADALRLLLDEATG